MKKKLRMLNDGFNNFTQNIDEQTGFLHLKGIVARTGIQEYYGLELAVDGLEPMKKYKVARLPDDVLNMDSLDSFKNATVTDDHPSDFVTVDNVKELNKGSVATVDTFHEKGTDYINTDVVITDKAVIKKVIDGKVELSAGYSQMLVEESGEFNGQSYDFKQTDIKINHIAVVDKGRCGTKCKLVADGYATIIPVNEINEKEKSMKIIKIGDTEIEVCDTVAGHISDLESKVESGKDEMKKKDEELEAKDGEIAQKEKDLEEEKAKKEESKATDSETIDALVSEKVGLMARATKVGVEVQATDSLELMKSKIEEGVISMADKLATDKKAFDSQKEAFKGLNEQKDSKKTFAELKDKEV